VLAVQEDELARADLAGPRWSAGTARRDLLSDAVGRARAAVSQAQVTEEVARRRWTVDRRSERVIERLVERVAAARTAAATRAEQAVVDEIAAVAHLRRVPQDATAPRALS
jgi:flagellar export protein FliJ